MRILKENNNTIIEELDCFDLSQTLECGQCFHFEQLAENDYVIVAFGKVLHITQSGNRLIFHDTDEKTVKEYWIHYFDLDRDYSEIQSFLLMSDERLTNAINEKSGIRILNQEFHETLISFIISQNKQIPHIKQLVWRISEKYGDEIGEINGKKYYSFPTIEKLGEITEDDFREMKTGFRAPYLYDASQKLANSIISVNDFKNLSEKEALEKLIGIKGVGEKVANCVMLFSLGYRNAFPVDVWIKRIMESLYFDGKDTPKDKISAFALERYGEYGGYAQQYLFCYGREIKMGKIK